MKLNEKCIDDVLLFLETETGITKSEHDSKFVFKRVTGQTALNAPMLTDKFSQEGIYYALLKIGEMGFATIKFDGTSQIAYIEDIKINGHIRLQQIHNKLEKPTE